VVPIDSILFASEMIGAIKGKDPETGRWYDDTKQFIDAVPHLTAEDRTKVYERNARRLFKRLDAALARA
jgi:4-oxalmesaconate hydratase